MSAVTDVQSAAGRSTGRAPRPLPIVPAAAVWIAWVALVLWGRRDDEPSPTQSALKRLLIVTAVLHAWEAPIAFRLARRHPTDAGAGSWAVSTLLWGVPNLLRLRRPRPAA